MSQGAIPAERWNAIEKELSTHDYIRTLDLADKLGVSVETMRRDLAALEEHGKLLRVRGGAVAPDRQREEGSYGERTERGQPQKAAIARAAARLVRDDAAIVVDVGTTALHLVKALPPSFAGLIITSSLPAAAEASERLDCEIIMVGGRLRHGDLAASGGRAQEAMRDFCPDLAFLGSGGLSPEAGLTDFHYEEVELRRVVLEVTGRSWVLADSSKFNLVAPFRVSAFDALAGLVTDQEPPAELRGSLAEAGVDIIVGGRREDEGL